MMTTYAEAVTIVSGLPRSGTSMMMSMLAAGGVEPMTDSLREADEDNPRGYLELERVKSLASDGGCLADAAGKAVKVISSLLKHLPPEHSYKIIFMRRRMKEVLASQKQMLSRRGEQVGGVSDEKLAESFGRHLKEVEEWLARRENVEVVYVDYNELLENPGAHIRAVNDFLGGGLDVRAMTTVIDKSLYRQRERPDAGVAPQTAQA
jgi:hypothetical protein